MKPTLATGEPHSPSYSPKWFLVPIAGAALFLIGYLLAAFHYPGGSQADAKASGFHWLHNYWCNLLNERAITGQPNSARPFGYAATAILMATLLCFWGLVFSALPFKKTAKCVAVFCGGVSLLLLPFLSTAYHDWIINVSASLGLVVTAIIYFALYKQRWYRLLFLGLANVVLVALNNYVYYATSLYWLPLLQKFTFASVLVWVCCVSFKLYRRKAHNPYLSS